MEDMDELYGNLGPECADSVLNHEEDSVDIYYGLDKSPRGDGNAEKPSALLSSRRLGEDMDLYEQIITEEQQEREATYNELKNKLDESQNQIRELLSKLQEIQTKDINLNKENTLLKKNICALIKTAKMEIARKDKEISRLTQRPMRGGFHGQNQLTSSRGKTWSQGETEDCGRREISQRREDMPNHLANPPGCSAAGAPYPSKIACSVKPSCHRTDHETHINSQNTEFCVSKSPHIPSPLQTPQEGVVRPNGVIECKERPVKLSESEVLSSREGHLKDQRERVAGITEKKLDQHEDKSGHAPGGLERKLSRCSEKRPHHPEDQMVLRRSGRPKSPPPQTHTDMSSHTKPDRTREEARSKRISLDLQCRPDLDGKGVELERSRSRRREDSTRGSSSETSRGKMDSSSTRERHRKEEKRIGDGSSRERRSTRCERHKEDERKRSRDGDRSHREDENKNSGERRTTRSEKSKEQEYRSAKENERGSRKSKVDDRRLKDRKSESHSEVRDKKYPTSPDKRRKADVINPDRKGDGNDRRKNSLASDTEEASSRKIGGHLTTFDKYLMAEVGDTRTPHTVKPTSDCKHDSRDGHRAMDNGKNIARIAGEDEHHKPKDGASERQKDTRVNRQDPSAVQSRNPDNDKHSSKKDQSKTTVSESVPTMPVESNGSRAGQSVSEENSPTRKLSFMETLNLTLSPVKKPTQLFEVVDCAGMLSAEHALSKSPEVSVTFDFEEFCVIDEISHESERMMEMDSDKSSPQPPATQPHPVSASEGQELDGSIHLEAEGIKETSQCCTGMEVLEAEGHQAGEIVQVHMYYDGMPQDRGAPKEFLQSSNSVNGPPGTTVNQSHNVRIEDKIPDNCLPSETSKTLPCEHLSDGPVVTRAQGQSAAICKENLSTNSATKVDPAQTEHKTSPVVHPEPSHEDQSSSPAVTALPEDSISKSLCPVSMVVVSNTANVGCVSQYHDDSEPYTDVTQATADSSVDAEKALKKVVSPQKPSRKPTTEAARVTTTSTEEVPPPSLPASKSTKPQSSPVQMDACSLEPSSSSEAGKPEPSSSVVLPPDEDSMMLTLRNIKLIPDAISPLTSPVQQAKKAQSPRPGKQAHVKNLIEDLASAASPVNANVMKKDMNKENKRPDGPHTLPSPSLGTPHNSPSPLVASHVVSTSGSQELEEGEIVSEEEEEKEKEDHVPIKSPPSRKDSKSSSRHWTSPRSTRLAKRASQTKPAITPERSGKIKKSFATDSNGSPSSNKRRFKTVSPLSSKTSISTIDEFMNMFKMIRMELRKKYMKLHKSFPKASFHCIIDMSLASFSEFVDSVNMDKLCTHAVDLKAVLKKIISSVMGKLSNNGIVNRIFQQQAHNLKQKLWTFVDGQFDFLFKEVRTTIASSCKRSKTKSSTVNCTSKKEISKVKNNNVMTPNQPMTANDDSKSTKKAKERVTAVDGKPKQKTRMSPNIISKKSTAGSDGKGIDITTEEQNTVPEEPASDAPLAHPSSQGEPISCALTSAERAASYVRRPSHNGSIQDKSDFEILTEQQTSSLTFNLVTDSQMGEIFKCLLQGSDLLDNTVVGDNTSWPVGTPQKDSSRGESLIGVITPSKNITPSKLIASWSCISPSKFSPQIQMPLNPSELDESCLLEVPANIPPIHTSPLTPVSAQRSFSILAEDLAVSLTLPSPLKSDNHLSFLHPDSRQPLSAPDSVISAHYSEDALLEEEDATEQDIRLALDTDNSSSGSNGSRSWEGPNHPVFQFRPNLPMQAVVMERSNDHFIVRIRHTPMDLDKVGEENPNEFPAKLGEMSNADACFVPRAALDTAAISQPTAAQAELNTSDDSNAHTPTTHLSYSPPEGGDQQNVFSSTDESEISGGVLQGERPQADPEPADTATPEVSSTTGEGAQTSEMKHKDDRVSRKRKKHHSGPKAKRSRADRSLDRHNKQLHKRRSKTLKEKDMKTPKKTDRKTPSPQLSPNSLSAENVVRKKGEVVMTWTRDEDRDILVELKMKGASSETFSVLSAKMNKSPAQIAERFAQLMKLFKKKEKMAS